MGRHREYRADKAVCWVPTEGARDVLGNYGVRVPAHIEFWTRGRDDAGEMERRYAVSAYLLYLDALLPPIDDRYYERPTTSSNGVCMARYMSAEVLALFDHWLENLGPADAEPKEGEVVHTEMLDDEALRDLVAEGGPYPRHARRLLRASWPDSSNFGRRLLHQHFKQRRKGGRWQEAGVTLQSMPRELRRTAIWQPETEEDKQAHTPQYVDQDCSHMRILRHLAPNAEASEVDAYLRDKTELREYLAGFVHDGSVRTAKQLINAIGHGAGRQKVLDFLDPSRPGPFRLWRLWAELQDLMTESGLTDRSELACVAQNFETWCSEASIDWLEQNGWHCTVRIHDGHFFRGRPMSAEDLEAMTARVVHQTGIPMLWDLEQLAKPAATQG